MNNNNNTMKTAFTPVEAFPGVLNVSEIRFWIGKREENKSWNIRAKQIDADRVQLHGVLEDTHEGLPQYGSVTISPAEFNELKLRKYDRLVVEVVALRRSDRKESKNGNPYVMLRFDPNDRLIMVERNKKLSDAVNKPYPPVVEPDIDESTADTPSAESED